LEELELETVADADVAEQRTQRPLTDFLEDKSLTWELRTV
jgi:hypothetical protein